MREAFLRCARSRPGRAGRRGSTRLLRAGRARMARDIWSSRRCSGSGANVARVDRKGAAVARDDRHIAEKRGNAGAVDGGGHHENTQVRRAAPKRRAPERGRGRHRGCARGTRRRRTAATPAEFGVVEDHAGEDALGDDFDARRLADPGVQPDAIADRSAKLFTEASGP